MAETKGDDAQKSNGFDADQAPQYVGRIEELQKQIDDIMDAAKKAAAPLREDIAEVKKEANENANIPRKELNATIQKRRLLAKADAVTTKLSDVQKDNFDRIWGAFDDLDDTPLGRAARKDGEEGTRPN